MTSSLRAALAATIVVAALSATLPASAQTGFVNWESPHVHPLEVTPDGSRLLAVNTADNRLEVFAIQEDGGLVPVGAVPVGLDPVSVRARTATEAWVVNHVSDTVSVVDLDALAVRATLQTGDEPADVVFAGAPERAFVSLSQENRVAVYDPAALDAAPQFVPIEGEDPRALATDGTRVFAAIFQAGNGTTIIGEETVSSSANPYGGNPNPPPNAGTGFDPPIDPLLPEPPETSLILRKDGGAWVDENGGDWSAAVTWDLHGHDVAVIEAGSLATSYVAGLMNTNTALAVSGGGGVVVIGLEAMNHLRFEPNLRGVFVRAMAASFTPPATVAGPKVDLNPHLDYTVGTVAPAVRAESIGDPRGVAVSADGSRLYFTGMGSSNVVVTTPALGRVGRVEVGEGPTGLVLNEGDHVLYTLNKFEGSISIVDLDALAEITRVVYHDPTPLTIRTGRPHLYDTHATSGLGQASCASCHVDGRMDQVSWDLGDPTGEMKTFDQVCNFGIGGCEDWHPMKGPMATQTLVGIIGTEPFHWRGDRNDLAEFNGAFESLLGDDAPLTPTEMDEFTDFVASLMPPPNPHRNLDGSLPSSVPGLGNPDSGLNLFNTAGLDGINCVDCHAMPSGTNGQLTSAILLQESQSMKIPQLRNMHEKTGFDSASASNNRGFGYIHDGSVDDLVSFLEFDGFQFAGGNQGNQQRRDVAAFMMCFSTDTHAGVGAQATMGGAAADQTARRDELLTIADGGGVALVVKGVAAGESRGYHYLGTDQFQSDRAGETASLDDLDAGLGPDAALTYTLVPLGTEVRIGVDRDADGHFDRDELDACSDPADGASVPAPGGCACPADVDGDGAVAFSDLLAVLAAWGPCPGCPEDLDDDGGVAFSDLLAVLSAWGPCDG